MPVRVPATTTAAISDVMKAVFGIEGVLHFAGDALTFEYRTKGMLGTPSAVTTAPLPLDEIHTAVLKRRVRGSQLLLYPRRLDLLTRVPGTHPDALTFAVEVVHRPDAAVLVEQLRDVLPAADEPVVPFRLPDTHLGLTENRGLLYLENDYLVLEVRSGMSGGLAQHEPQITKVELAALREIQHVRRHRRDRILVYPKKPALLDLMPGVHKEALTLSVHRRHRDGAEQLVYEARRLRRRAAP